MNVAIGPATELVYIGDPMCSWCWGFAPALDRLVNQHEIPLRIVVGGLRPGPSAQPLEPGLRGELRSHWEHVAEASGQPFDFAALDARPDDWVYDTELPARAVVTMRRLNPSQEVAFFFRLQRAFYTDGVDITDAAVYEDLLPAFSVDADAFMTYLRSDQSQTDAWTDFRWAHDRKVRGFPTTLLRTGERLRMLAAGYVPYEQVDTILHASLERFAPYDPVTASVCAIDGTC